MVQNGRAYKSTSVPSGNPNKMIKGFGGAQLVESQFPDQELNPDPPVVRRWGPNHRTAREFWEACFVSFILIGFILVLGLQKICAEITPSTSILLPPTNPVSPIFNILHQCDTFVTTDEPLLTHHYSRKPQFTLRFTFLCCKVLWVLTNAQPCIHVTVSQRRVSLP